MGRTVGGAYPVDKLTPHHATVLTPDRGNGTILVVEDEVLVRAVVTDELRQQGYTVVEAANAEDALSVLHSNVRVDLLLTDVQMPGSLDGVGLARLVRADYPFVKVVMASSRMPDIEANETADGFFSKPYDFPKLFGHIKALVARGTTN